MKGENKVINDWHQKFDRAFALLEEKFPDIQFEKNENGTKVTITAPWGTQRKIITPTKIEQSDISRLFTGDIQESRLDIVLEKLTNYSTSTHQKNRLFEEPEQ